MLPGDSVRYTPGADPGVYDMSRSKDLRFAVSAESVFGDGSIVQRGNREMRIAELKKEEARKRAAKISPHPEIIQRHQMFAFPVACLVFALVGLALGIHSRKEGKFGGFTLGLAVLFAYYGIMVYFEARTKGGRFPAEWARWMPNIILGVVSLAAIRWRMRAVGGGVAIRLPGFLAKAFRRSASSEPASKTSLTSRGRHPDPGHPTPPPALAGPVRQPPVSQRRGALIRGIARALLHRHGHRQIRTAVQRYGGRLDAGVVSLLLHAAVSCVRHPDGHSLRGPRHRRRLDA